MPRKTRGHPRGSKSRNTAPAIDHELVRSSRTAGSAVTNFPAEDMLRSAPNMLLTQTPPKNIRGQIHWVQAQYVRVNSLSSSANSEINYSFALSDIANVVGFTGFFDQYCIYAVVITVQCNDVGVSASTETGRGYTAIDYDNVNNIGSEAAIQAYGTCVTWIPGGGSVQQRLIKPCVAPAYYNTGAVFTGFGVGRCWIDSASPSVPHYGYRSYYAANTVGGINLDHVITYVIGFRNNN